MNVNQVSFTGAPKAAKKPLTKGQKTAAIAGAVAGTAAVASFIAAGVIGKPQTPNAKYLEKVAEGYKTMGGFIAGKATQAWGWITDTVGKFIPKAEDAVDAAEEIAAEIVDEL